MRYFAIILSLLCVIPCLSDDPKPGAPTYNIEAGGRDVRDVIHNLFSQAKKSYVLDPNVRFQMYLTMYNVDFDAAFALLREQAKLQYEVRDNVYYISPMPVIVAAKAEPTQYDWTPALSKKVTIKRDKVAIRSAFQSLAGLTGIRINVDPNVPEYLVNVSFNGVSLKYALDNLTKAAQLTYRTNNDGSVRVSGAVSVADENKKPEPAAGDMKCPNCKAGLHEGWKYCPLCGYWVKPITGKG